ncbi:MULTISPECIES: hypothetical protein [Chryseobacterium]|uniref:hypothetical protein n=1 Tax=Chryseobacterium TaxID=59732 RepID=UPI0031D3F03A
MTNDHHNTTLAKLTKSIITLNDEISDTAMVMKAEDEIFLGIRLKKRKFLNFLGTKNYLF